MWKRLSLLAALGTTLATAAAAQTQTPAQITNVSSGGIGSVTISSTTDGFNADIGLWSGSPNVFPSEPMACAYFYVDINVNDGGTLIFKYNQRAWGGLWFGGAGSPDQDWLDVYLLTPGTVWNPGSIWSEDGSERCFRSDWPTGVLPLVRDFDYRDYSPPCANGTTSCVRQSPDIDFSLSLNRWAHQSVRVVFRQWLDGYGDETQSRIRNVSVGACPVTPLTPLTDPDALAFENGNTLNTAGLTQTMQSALACLTTAVVNDGGTFGNTALNSAYRPPAYQAHLREVWDKWQLLSTNRSPACAVLRSAVLEEINRHDMENLRVRPASPAGPHTQGAAIDVNFGQTGLTVNRVVELADGCDLIRPLPDTDRSHFTHR